jgi:hypothetical protein
MSKSKIAVIADADQHDLGYYCQGAEVKLSGKRGFSNETNLLRMPERRLQASRIRKNHE